MTEFVLDVEEFHQVYAQEDIEVVVYTFRSYFTQEGRD